MENHGYFLKENLTSNQFNFQLGKPRYIKNIVLISKIDLTTVQVLVKTVKNQKIYCNYNKNDILNETVFYSWDCLNVESKYIIIKNNVNFTFNYVFFIGNLKSQFRLLPKNMEFHKDFGQIEYCTSYTNCSKSCLFDSKCFGFSISQDELALYFDGKIVENSQRTEKIVYFYKTAQNDTNICS